MDNFSVYVHTFPNGKKYVGITVQKPEARWGKNGGGYRGQPYVFNAIKKFGWDNISHEIVAQGLTQTEAEKMERALIKQYDSANKKFGYNVDLGGNHSGKYTEERRRQISEQQKGRKMSKEYCEAVSKRLKGHTTSDETRAKISAANKGRHLSEETKRKISEANYRRGEEWREKLRELSLNRSPEINKKIALSLTGRKQSEETKQKRADKLRGRKHSISAIENMRLAQRNRSPEWESKRAEASRAVSCKPVQQLSTDGIVLGEYASATEAAKGTGLRLESICRAARGSRKTYSGYIWRYINTRKEA